VVPITNSRLLFLGSGDVPLALRRSLPDFVGVASARPAEPDPLSYLGICKVVPITNSRLLFLGSGDVPLALRRSLPDFVGVASARPAEPDPLSYLGMSGCSIRNNRTMVNGQPVRKRQAAPRSRGAAFANQV